MNFTSVRRYFTQELRRNTSLFIISFISLFAVLPYHFLKDIAEYANYAGTSFQNAGGSAYSQREAVLCNLTYENLGIPFSLAFMAVVFGIFLFSFLFQRQKEDFYFGQPIKRKTLFLVNYIQGVVYAAVPFILCSILILLIAVPNHCFSGKLVYVLFQIFIVNMLFFLSVYSLTILACCLTGSLFFACMGTGVLLGYCPALYMVFYYIFDGHMQHAGSLIRAVCKLSPIGWYEAFYQNIDQKMGVIQNESFPLIHFSGSLLIGCLILTAVCAVASCLLFCIRRAEDAGKPVVFPMAANIIKGFMTVLISLGSPVLFTFVFQSQRISIKIAGFLIGFVISVYLMDTFMTLDWKASFQKWKWQWIYAVISLIIVGSFYGYSDQFRYHGFDNVPKDYTEEQARKDGCIILKNGHLAEGLESWKRFEDAVNEGEDAKLRLYYGSYGRDDCVDFVHRDGKVTVYSPNDSNGEVLNLPYARAVTGKIELDGEEIERTVYLLTDKPNLTFQDYQYIVQGNSDSNEHDVSVICLG